MNLIAKLRNALTIHPNDLAIEMFSESQEIAFKIWEDPVYVIVDFEKDEVYYDPELSERYLNSEELAEIVLFMRILESHKAELRSWLVVED